MPPNKIAAHDEIYFSKSNVPVVVVRAYDEERDKAAVEELEWRCEVGQPGKLTLVTDLMGDPIARVRNFASHVMLVAEFENGREILGVIRGCIKTVSTHGKRRPSPQYTKLAYILGLRVSSNHRRLGIATKLVQELERWCVENGAEYAYMATEGSNKPSLNLFTQKGNYVKFRNPTVLVQPVHLHRKPLSSDVEIVRISPRSAKAIYRRSLSRAEFFPKDINNLLDNRTNIGTFMALPKRDGASVYYDRESGELLQLPPSFAILSVWNAMEVYKVRLRGVSVIKHVASLGTRVVDGLFPWLRVPSVPDFMRSFGFYFLYGLHMEGRHGTRLMRSLCMFVHNLARDEGNGECRAVVAEVGPLDPVREAVPHWKRFSWDEDVWCIKKLIGGENNNNINNSACDDIDDDDDWCKYENSSAVMFVDPRDL